MVFLLHLKDKIRASNVHHADKHWQDTLKMITDNCFLNIFFIFHLPVSQCAHLRCVQTSVVVHQPTSADKS